VAVCGRHPVAGVDSRAGGPPAQPTAPGAARWGPGGLRVRAGRRRSAYRRHVPARRHRPGGKDRPGTAPARRVRGTPRFRGAGDLPLRQREERRLLRPGHRPSLPPPRGCPQDPARLHPPTPEGRCGPPPLRESDGRRCIASRRGASDSQPADQKARRSRFSPPARGRAGRSGPS